MYSSRDECNANTSSHRQSPLRRISHACDRCRIKKAKCCGGNPCTKCTQAGALCVFGDKIRSNGKTYPKGYVQMLERQQRLLVSAVQTMFHDCQDTHPGLSHVKTEADGLPRVQDVLQALGLVSPPSEFSSRSQSFHELGPELEIHYKIESPVPPEMELPNNSLVSVEAGNSSRSDQFPDPLCIDESPILWDTCSVNPMLIATDNFPSENTCTRVPGAPRLTPQVHATTHCDPYFDEADWMLESIDSRYSQPYAGDPLATMLPVNT